MMKSSLSSAAPLLIAIAILTSITICNAQTNDLKCLSTDRRALLDLKKGLKDPDNALSSWRGVDCCRWRGITCDNITGSVSAIDLSKAFSLGGEISPSILQITSLKHLDLSSTAFASAFPDWLVNMTSLVHLDLSSCLLTGRIPLGLSLLPNLRYLNLGLNRNLSASAHSLLDSGWRRIEVLNFASCKIHGKIPASVGNLTSLTTLDMSDNHVEGGVPTTIGSLCELVMLDLPGNEMTGNLPEFVEGCGDVGILPNLEILRLSNNQLSGNLPDWLGQVKNLKELSLSYNFFEGSLPASIGSLLNLTDLSLAGNRLNGTLPRSIGRLSELVVLDLSSNFFTGDLTEMHFSEMGKVKILGLSSNSFVFNVASNWLPPFQVRNLNLGSCQLGHSFPSWLKSQEQIMFLDISNASISDTIPVWFWDQISFNLSLLNVSFNQLQGQLPSSFEVRPYADVDLSHNLLEGLIPLPSVPIELLDLSNNRFHGPIPKNMSDVMPDLIFLSLSGNNLTGKIPDSIGKMSSISVIELSRNNLSGSIPSSIGECSYLKVLDLAENNLSGEIPNSVGDLKLLQSLHINNFISGKFPSFFKNLSNLETLDLGNNALEGTLPPWLGEGFNSLRIINLRANKLSGGIPVELANLSSLQVLDLAENAFIGRIPTSFGDLRGMAQEQMRNEYLLYGKYRGVYYEESLVVNAKNQMQKYTKTVSLMIAIDLSGNSLSGDIPVELTHLTGLVILNLSGNRLTGQIPNSISRLRQLGSLDLSSNELSGPIPPTMGMLSFLGYLNLSNNHLSGEIPVGGHMLTFDADAYAGNPGLCGDPLAVMCGGEGEGDGDGNGVVYTSSKDGFIVIDGWFYLSIGLGFAVGVVVPCILLVIKKPWSDRYFDFLDMIIEKYFIATKKKKKKKVQRRTSRD